MEGMQGAILRVKLRHLEEWTEARRAHAARYARSSPTPASGSRPRRRGAGTSTTCTPCGRREREALMKRLDEQGIQTGIHYPIPVHLQPAYADPAWGKGSFPHAERAADEVLSLPMYPEMTEEHLQAVSAGRSMAGRARVVKAVHGAAQAPARPGVRGGRWPATSRPSSAASTCSSSTSGT